MEQTEDAGIVQSLTKARLRDTSSMVLLGVGSTAESSVERTAAAKGTAGKSSCLV